MANYAYLLNVGLPTNSREVLDLARKREGREYVSVEGPKYRIPLPWLRCFRQEELRPYLLDDYAMQVPVTTVEQAIRNLTESWPMYLQLVGNEAIARGYWQDAIDALRAFRLPYLTIDVDEIFVLSDLDENRDALLHALGSNPDPFPGLGVFFSYDPVHLPYPIEVFHSDPDARQQDRIENCIALHFNG